MFYRLICIPHVMLFKVSVDPSSNKLLFITVPFMFLKTIFYAMLPFHDKTIFLAIRKAKNIQPNNILISKTLWFHFLLLFYLVGYFIGLHALSMDHRKTTHSCSSLIFEASRFSDWDCIPLSIWAHQVLSQITCVRRGR